MGKKKSLNNAEKTNNTEHKHDGRRKERGIVPYITVPLLYVLISMVFVIPLFLGFVNSAVNAVHNFQKDFTISYCDMTVSSERFDNKTLVYENDKIGLCEKVGVIKCNAAGIKQNVYYGINRVSLRSGAALSTESSFGDGNIGLNVAGYSKGALRGLNNLKEDDIITFETTDKVYTFTVVSNSVGEFSADNQAALVISCDDESKAFSAMENENRYVIAHLREVSDKKGE